MPGSEALRANHDSLGRPSVEYLKERKEDVGKPSGEIRRKGTLQAFKRAAAKFGADGCTDIAASLTYYAVLSVFPALIALVSTLGVFGQGQETVDTIIELLSEHVPEETVAFVQGPLEGLATSQGAGLALVIGILGALWTASGYVGAFSRALNRIYKVAEGRPIWILRPILLGVTAVLLVLVACAMLMLTLSGGFAEVIFDAIGIGETGLQAWNIAKWPALLLIFIIIVSLLYQLTPNVRQLKFRILSLGGLFALVMLGVAVLGFGFYVSNFGNYDATYGSLAGIIIGLLLLWIANLALLFGAEIDSELERSRLLEMGIESERYIQLPLRNEKGVVKALEKEEKAVEASAEIRRAATADFSRDRSDSGR